MDFLFSWTITYLLLKRSPVQKPLFRDLLDLGRVVREKCRKFSLILFVRGLTALLFSGHSVSLVLAI